MKLFRILLVAAFAGATFAASGTAFAVASPQAISIAASNWKFTPGEITVHVGQPVTLNLTSTEGVHGLQSSDLGIAMTTIAPGSTKSVTFKPTKPGTYVLHCAIPCGAGHANMKLIVRVVP